MLQKTTMQEQHYFNRGNLPHLFIPSKTYFVTDRLYGSIPCLDIDRLKAAYQQNLSKIESEEKKSYASQINGFSFEDRALAERVFHEKKYDAQKRYYGSFDDFLDNNLNEFYHLKNPEVAQLVLDAYKFYIGKQYDLWAICIMGNHVHALFKVLPDSDVLWKIMQNIKKYTATQSNKILGLEGKFWERESYDHILRKDEFENIVRYIINNPVKAGLVARAEDWKWTWVHPDIRSNFF